MNNITRQNGKFRPLDIALLIYLAIQMLLIFLFMAGKPGWLYFLMFYTAAAGISIIFAVFPMPENNTLWKALRLSYPFFLFTFLYEALGPQVFMIFKEPFDSHIVGLENAVLGVDMAFALQSRMEIWLNEVMNLGYISYYFMIPAAVLLLVFRRRWNSLEKLALAVSISFYVSYLIFVFYPVVGPRFYLQDHYYLPMIGPYITPLTREIVGRAGLYGGAMPSSHCAVALVVVTIVAAEFRKLRIVSLALLVLLCVSTVYGRYHYISDVAVGLILGWLSIILGDKWQNKYKIVNDGERVEISGAKTGKTDVAAWVDDD